MILNRRSNQAPDDDIQIIAHISNSIQKQDLRPRVARELTLLGAATVLYLLFGPRGIGVYLLLAILFAGYVFYDWRRNRALFWDRPKQPAGRRYAVAGLWLGSITLAFALLFAALTWQRWLGIDHTHLILAVLIYLPWALVQQFIFQYYLHGRLRVLLAGAPAAVTAVLTGLTYALVHAPEWRVVAITAIAGPIWSWVYFKQRALLVIAASHALAGVLYYYLLVGRDLFDEMWAFLP